MTVYTVHEPPPRKRGRGDPADRIVFVRDGFSFWAFLFGPLWMIWRRLWLALTVYIVVTAIIQIALWAVRAPDAVNALVEFLIALLVGLEAGTLRRWSLRRWRERGIVVAPNLQLAERRFFDTWPEHEAFSQPVPPPSPSTPPRHVPTSDADVIGLFPEAQARP